MMQHFLGNRQWSAWHSKMFKMQYSSNIDWTFWNRLKCKVKCLTLYYSLRITFFAHGNFSKRYFWPRALLKGAKRSFVVLVGVETWGKMFQIKRKILQKEQKLFANDFVPCLALCLKRALFDLLCHCMAFYGLLGFLLPFGGHLWQNIDLTGFISSFLAVIDPNSFGFVILIYQND